MKSRPPPNKRLLPTSLRSAAEAGVDRTIRIP